MNSFPGWLEVVLVVAVLALLAGGVSLNHVQEWRVRQNVENHRGTQGKPDRRLADRPVAGEPVSQ